MYSMQKFIENILAQHVFCAEYLFDEKSFKTMYLYNIQCNKAQHIHK